MSFQNVSTGVLDYASVRYGSSKLLFRGPKPDLKGRYNVFLGGTETYGKYTPQPFPDLVGQITGIPSVNLGCLHAGAEAFLKEVEIAPICRGAHVTVIQITGAQNNTNRFYTVHPRRNDRFLRPSELLRTFYQDVDFTGVSFTRHLLNILRQTCENRFEMVVAELKSAWVARMKKLLAQTPGPVVLLKLSGSGGDAANPMSFDPPYVDRDMIRALGDKIDGLVVAKMSQRILVEGSKGMIFQELDRVVADQMLPIAGHQKVAAELGHFLKRMA